MTSAFGNLITLLIVALFSTIGFEQVNKKVQSQKSKAFKLLSEWPFSSTFGFKFLAPTGALDVAIWDLCPSVRLSVYFIE